MTRLTPSASETSPRPISPAQTEPSRPAAEGAPTPPTSAGLAAPASAVARGQDCKQAIASLGPPDRQRDVPALDAGTDPITEYFYEPSSGTGATRMRVVCANGKVEGVDRSVIR